MSDKLIGTVINERYRLTEILGQGGMGIVFKAEDLRLNNRLCAVKLLKGQTTDPNEAKRFEAELQIISRLRSPHVVQVLDTGYFGGHRLYIVMELLEGAPLSQVLKECGAFPVTRAIQVCKGILAGLSEAHEYGIVHRDLKPANIFITRSRAGDEITKVLDFGIAKDTNQNDASGLTSASMIIGTPKYMAPEQFMKQATDSRTDIYAVGLLLYQMLSGTPPFTGNHPDLPPSLKTMPSEFRVGWLHVNAKASPIPVAPDLWNLLESMISKDAEKRPNQASDVIVTLNQILNNTSGQSLAATTPMPATYIPDIPAKSISHSSPQPQLDALSENYSKQEAVVLRNLEVEIDEDPATTGIPLVTEHYQTIPSQQKESSIKLWGIIITLGLLLGGLWQFSTWSNISNKKQAKQATKVCYHTLSVTPSKVKVIYVDTKTAQESELGVTSKDKYNVSRPCHKTWKIKLKRIGYQAHVMELAGDKFKQVDTIELKKEISKQNQPTQTKPPKKTTKTQRSYKPKKTKKRYRSKPKRSKTTSPVDPTPKKAAPKPTPPPKKAKKLNF